MPAVVVGVVGMGHVPGIERNWEKELSINEIMRYVRLVWKQYNIVGDTKVLDQRSLLCLSLLQCCTPLTFGLCVAHSHKGRHGGSARIRLLPCRREYRQSHAVFTCNQVFTGNSAATPCLTPLTLSKPLTMQ